MKMLICNRGYQVRLGACLLLICHFLMPRAVGSSAAFLKLGDIRGESNEASHRDWIEIESFSHGIRSDKNDGMEGFPRLKSFEILKPVEKASPLILKAYAENETIPLVRLHFVREGPGMRFYQIELREVKVSDWKIGTPPEAPVPMEGFSLNYEEIRWTYTEFDPNQQPIRDHVWGWNTVSEVGGAETLPPGAFRVSGGTLDPQVPESGFQLRWTGYEEFRYRILFSMDPAGPYEIFDEIAPSRDGDQIVDIPADGPQWFFLIERLAETGR